MREEDDNERQQKASRFFAFDISSVHSFDPTQKFLLAQTGEFPAQKAITKRASTLQLETNRV